MIETARMLDRLYVASPCFADWEAMAGDNQARFCDQCQLNVYNISAMTTTQAEGLIAQTEGRLCTRLFRRADGTIITQDCPVGIRAIRRRVSRTACAVLGAILSVFTSRTLMLADHNNCSHYKAKVIKLASPVDRPSIQGTVHDLTKQTLADVTVTLTNDKTEQKHTVKTNEKGQFGFSALPPGKYSISIWAPGFATFKKRDINMKASKGFELTVVLQLGMTGGAALLPATPESNASLQKPV